MRSFTPGSSILTSRALVLTAGVFTTGALVVFSVLGILAPQAAHADPYPLTEQQFEQGIDKVNQTYNPHVSAIVHPPTSVAPFSGCTESIVDLIAVDPVTLELGNLQLKQYMPKSAEASPSDARTILIVPPTGGENVIDRGYADIFCFNGFRVAILETYDGLDDAATDFQLHERGSLRALAAIRHTIQYLDPASPSKLGLLGTSLGAIDGALAVGFDYRISAATFIVGGGNLPEIIAHSNEAPLVQLGEQRMKRFGIPSIDQYAAELAENIDIDPLSMANLSGPKKILQFIGTKDLTVPTTYQFMLHNAFGGQPYHTYAGDHFDTIVHTFLFDRDKIVQFFKDNLE